MGFRRARAAICAVGALAYLPALVNVSLAQDTPPSPGPPHQNGQNCPGSSPAQPQSEPPDQVIEGDPDVQAAEQDVTQAQQGLDAAKAANSSASAALVFAQSITAMARARAAQTSAADRAAGQAAIKANAVAESDAKKTPGGSYVAGVFPAALNAATALKAADAANTAAQTALANASKAEAKARSNYFKANERLGWAIAALQAAQDRLAELKAKARERIILKEGDGTNCPPAPPEKTAEHASGFPGNLLGHVTIGIGSHHENRGGRQDHGDSDRKSDNGTNTDKPRSED